MSDVNESTDQQPNTTKPNLHIVDGLKEQALGMLDAAVTAEIDNYDAATVTKFLNLILHHGINEDEELPLWRSRVKIPTVGYPVDEDAFFRSTLNGKYNMASRCYVGTATLSKTPEGKLRNKQEHIMTTRMIILDDIGTKYPANKIKLPPTYKIESSKGNYQYGYVYKEPIDKPAAAAEFVTLVYEAGLSDSGGKMANKLVRLPCGVNGKAGDGCLFEVKLTECHPELLYTPQEILDGLGIEADWSEIYEDAEKYSKAHANISGGASLWTAAVAPTLDGIVDPVLEFLIESGLYEGDTGDYVTIKCPNGHLHTSGDDTAGYRPLGRGKQPTTRAFSCFHDHCSSFTTSDFLAYINANGGPAAAVRDDAASLTCDWVYDAHNNAVWKIKGLPHPKMFSIESFRMLHPHKVALVAADGSVDTKMSQHQLWHYSRSRINTYGSGFFPADTARLVDVNGDKYVNTYAPPAWGLGAVDERHLKKFTDFLEYLIPTEDERNYFLDWLACKVQNMGFRGSAIVMIALQQGTGRTTMSDMLASLFGHQNVVNQPFDKLIGDSPFNEWQEAPLVITDETLNTGENSFYRTYERLKELVDPRPKMTTINPKYGKKRETYVYSSYLMFSNHKGALALSENDRRFYVIGNAAVPESTAFFEALNVWLNEKSENGKTAWCPHVWRWLMKREVSVAEMLAPAKSTAGKIAMQRSSTSPLDAVLKSVIQAHANADVAVTTAAIMTDMLEHFAARIDLYDIPKWKTGAKRYIKEFTLSTGGPLRVDGKLARPRIIQSAGVVQRPRLMAKIADAKSVLNKDDNNWLREELIALNELKAEIIADADVILGDYDV